MKILQVHNTYLSKGGEDRVVELERDLLREYGHEVYAFSVSNADIAIGSAASNVAAGLSTIWNHRSYRAVLAAINDARPNLIHVHNTFSRLSPAVYWAAARARVPIVQTLHNYRLTCANGLLLRDSKPCQLCVGRLPVPAIRYRCYRDTLAPTISVVAMQSFHQLIRTYQRNVHAFIALTSFARGIFSQAGLPTERIYVKPNFVHQSTPMLIQRRNQVVFVGRLDDAKGAHLLLQAWAQATTNGTTLVIIGEGPQATTLRARFAKVPNIEWRGRLPESEVQDLIGKSRLVLVPSLAYEGFPMVLVEAFSVGTPVIAPDHGGFPEIITASGGGWLFQPGDVSHLKNTLQEVLLLPEEELARAGEAAYSGYTRLYTPQENYAILMEIYASAIRRFDNPTSN